jgi:hypothetical protein
LPLTTRETVWIETPASSATSRIVGAATLLRIFSASIDRTNAIAPMRAEEVSEREYCNFIVHLNDKKL